MRIGGLTIGLIVGAAFVTAALPVAARVGVARVVLSGGEDVQLCRTVEDVLAREVTRLGHEVVEPAEIEPLLEGVDRSQPLKTGEWIAVAASLSLDAVVVTRLAIDEGQVSLVLRVVFPDGPRDESETAVASPPNAPYSARKLLEPLLGRAHEVDEPSAVEAAPGPIPPSAPSEFEDLSEQDLAKVERAVGRDLSREYAQFQRRGPHPPGAYVRYRIRAEEEKHKRSKLCAALVPPALLVVGGGLGTLLYVRGVRAAEEDANDEDDHAGMIDEAGVTRALGITLICVGGVGAFTALLVCLAKMYTASGNIERLQRLLPGDRDSGADDQPAVSVAPIIGPDGTLGVGAALYF